MDDLDDGPVVPRPPPAPVFNSFSAFTNRFGVFPYFTVNYQTSEAASNAQNTMLRELLTNLNVCRTRDLPFLRMPAPGNLLIAFDKLFIARCAFFPRYTTDSLLAITRERAGIYCFYDKMFYVSSKNPARYQVNAIQTTPHALYQMLQRIDRLKALMALHNRHTTFQDICSLICENPRPLHNSEITVLLSGRITFLGSINLLKASVALQLQYPEENIDWLPIVRFQYLHIFLLNTPDPKIMVFRFPPARQPPHISTADVDQLGTIANVDGIPHFIKSIAQYHRNSEHADPEQADASTFWKFIMSVIAEKRRLPGNTNGIRYVSFTTFIDADNALRLGGREVSDQLASQNIDRFLRIVTEFLLDDNTVQAIRNAPMQFATAHGLVEYSLWDNYRLNGTITSGDIAIGRARQEVDNHSRSGTPHRVS